MSAAAGFGGGGGLRGSDALAGLDPRTRLLALLVLAGTVVSLGSGVSLTVALAVAALAVAAARLPMRLVLSRLAALDGLMLLVLLTVPFSMPGTALFTLGPFTASGEGLAQALALAAKANAVLLLTLALTAGTPPAAIGQGLLRLGVPERLVHLLLLTLRYVSVLGDEYRRLRRSMTARAFRPRTDRHTWQSLGWLVGMLLVRGVERAERVQAAMKCRGWDGRLLFVEDLRLRGADAAFAVLCLGAVLMLLGLDRG